jgi:hypothetical protein
MWKETLNALNLVFHSNMHRICSYRTEPSKEMKAALKVLNDYLRKCPVTSVPHHLKNATNIVQQEWFKVRGFWLEDVVLGGTPDFVAG